VPTLALTSQLGLVAKGIVSTARFGTASIGGFSQTITGVGITSKIVYGVPTLTRIGYVIQPPAFINPNLFGTPVIDIGSPDIFVTGITPTARFGGHRVDAGLFIRLHMRMPDLSLMPTLICSR
jgi:hypothetical protein